MKRQPTPDPNIMLGSDYIHFPTAPTWQPPKPLLRGPDPDLYMDDPDKRDDTDG